MDGDEQTPRLRWPLALASLVAAATGLGLFFGSRTYFLYNAYPENDLSWAEALRPSLVDWYLWALFVPLIVWLAWRFPIERGAWRRPLMLHIVAGFGIALAKIGLDVTVGRPLAGLDPRPFFSSLRFSFHPNLMTFAVLLGLTHGVLYYRRFRDRELRASRLEARLAGAELQVLRMQLHPHFLFNTLHAIGTLMHRDVDAAERMLTRLSDLLRVTIERAGSNEVPLRQEIEFLDRYLEIERTRFADRLEVALEAEPGTLDLPVPHLVLQPIVENAIRHGIAPRARGGRVDVRAQQRNGWLELTVRDDGLGLSASKAKPDGVGIANTRARLEQMYGRDHRFEIRDADGGGVEVTIAIKAAKPEPDERR